MHNKSIKLVEIIFITIVSLLLVTECDKRESLNNAIAIISNANLTVKGKIFFAQLSPDKVGVKVSGRVEGLSPGGHGIHVHKYGDLTLGCKSVGPHFDDKQNGTHGGRNDTHGHRGDLGNIVANDSGVADVSLLAPQLTLKGENSIIGRAVLIHVRRDDLGRGHTNESHMTGNSGPAVGCGIIAWDNLKV